MFKKGLFFALLIGLCFAAFGQDEGDFEIQADNETITIIKYTGTNKDIVIPEAIGGIPVTAIGEKAFQYCRLNSVTIPDTVTAIGSYAFNDNRLTSVVIGNSVATIGERAFYGNKLTEVAIPRSVVSIGKAAFQYNRLSTVTIPNAAASVEKDAFSTNVKIVR